jgi:DNA-binding transcriptional LysR family regulator
MQIESLKIFCDVARLRSFSRGAEANRVIQSTASQTVQHLEEHLGVELIDRSCRPWKLTNDGRRFYEGCRPIVDRYFDLEAKIKQARADQESVVRVAAIYSVGLGNMSQEVETFEQTHPGTQVQIEYLHPDAVLEHVAQEQDDLGILSFPCAGRDMTVIPWRQEPMVFVCHPSHRLARSRSISVKQLDGEGFVAFNRDLVIRREIDRFLKRHKTSVDVRLEFDNVEAIKRAVEVESGVAILPLPTLERELASRTLAAVPFHRANFARPLGIIHRRGRKISGPTLDFINQLRHGANGNGTANGNGHHKKGHAS